MANNIDNSAIYPYEPSLLICDRFTEPYGYHVYRTKGTPNWLLTFTLSGEGRYAYGEHSFPCRTGDVVLVRPHTPHDYRTPEGSVWTFVWAHFIPPPSWAEWLGLPERLPGHLYAHIEDDETAKRMQAAFDRVLLDSRQMAPYWHDLCLASLQELLLLAVRSQTAPETGRLDPRVGEVLRLLSERMKEPLRIEELAEQVFLSPSRLSHLFKQQTGQSVMDTLQRMRLRQAARLLAYTSRPAANVAEDVGFQDYSNFNKRFVAFYGASPSAYRKQEQQRLAAQAEPADAAFSAEEAYGE
ncbi:helix-turn-helix domain-containing protein [Gordoniibacillus kamchatkensis]|uniref:helix-turn-helix domain-containing protein n=1 Tax=Gordoniibacillus kamchatkensis TaxID=1590651 RepID=UPI0006960C69|nr:helix-turn-helix domain-containing protein [Paenibacillus sp. VKM B-2647]